MARSRGERSLLLDVESLRAFRELAAQGGFTAASRVLGLAQPTVSFKIRRLEERVGMSLIRRHGHSFTLTAHGRDLLAHAEEIVEAHDRAVDNIRRSELSGAVRLGCNEEVAASGLSQVAGRFRRTHPDIDLAIRVHDSAFVTEWLDVGEIDVALIQLIELDGAVRVTDEVWRRDELHVLQGLAADFDNADPVPLVSFGPGNLYDPHLIGPLVAAGRSHRHAVECPGIRGVQSAIEAGLGVGVLNTPNVTERMRPWEGIGPVELPAVAFVLRSRADAEGDEVIAALRGHLSAALASYYS